MQKIMTMILLLFIVFHVHASNHALPEEVDVAWLSLRDRCQSLRHYQQSGNTLRASRQQFISYLRIVENRNPRKNWKQIITALHSAAYQDDTSRSLPILGYPLFIWGEDTSGYKQVDLVCYVNIKGQKYPFIPKFVYNNLGKEADLAHGYAGLRSDLNRGDSNYFAKNFMRAANTNFGDYWQVYFDGISKFPMNQLRGNLVGVYLSAFYRKPSNQNIPLSKAFKSFFYQTVVNYKKNKSKRKRVCTKIESWKQMPKYNGRSKRVKSGYLIEGGSFTNGRLRNGYYDGNSLLSKISFDTSDGAQARMRFALIGGGKYMHMNSGFIEGTSAVPLTTHNTWANSRQVPEKKWLYGKVAIKPDGRYILTISSLAYDGQILVESHGTLSNKQVRFFVSFADNYAGKKAGIIISKAEICTGPE